MRGEIAPRKILNVKRQRRFGLSVFSICKLYKWIIVSIAERCEITVHSQCPGIPGNNFSLP